MHQGHNDLNVAVTSSHEQLLHQHNPVGGAAAAANNGAAAAQNPQLIMNAAGGQAIFDDDEEANRDWLDISYLLIRFSLLLMIVYFYSSMSRFLVVAGLFTAIWM